VRQQDTVEFQADVVADLNKGRLANELGVDENARANLHAHGPQPPVEDGCVLQEWTEDLQRGL